MKRRGNIYRYPLRHGLRRATSPEVRGKGFSAAFLAPTLGELSPQVTERASFSSAALPSPSRLAPCHLPQSGRHWHIGSAHADQRKLCIPQNAGPCRPDSQVRCRESRPQGPVVLVMRSDLPGLPRALPLGELDAKRPERALPLKDSLRPEGDVAFSDRGRTSCRASARLRGYKNTPYHLWYGVCGNDSDETQAAGSVIRSQNTVIRVLPP